MVFFEINGAVYKNLTKPDDTKTNQKWTLYLALCCLVVCNGSFLFGYNVGSFSITSPKVFEYYDNTYFKELFYDKYNLYKKYETKLRNGIDKYNAGFEEFVNKTELLNFKKNEFVAAEYRRDNYLDILTGGTLEEITKAKNEKKKAEEKIRAQFNMSVEEFFPYAENKLKDAEDKWNAGRAKLLEAYANITNGTQKLSEYRPKLEAGKNKKDFAVMLFFAFTVCLFIVGCLIGALSSKYVMDKFGRKNGIVFHYLFSVIGAVCMILPLYLDNSKLGPVLIKIGRFWQGVQGGMSCSLVPTYLSEIAPSALRGQIGTIHNVFLTSGILVSQVLGMEMFLGNERWILILVLPFIPTIIGALLLLIFFDETPKFLLFELSDEAAAKKTLRKLRNTDDVSTELTKMYVESSEKSGQTMTIRNLLFKKKHRTLLFTSIVLQFAQQFSGITALLFYIYFIVMNLGFEVRFIEYCVISTGIVQIISAIFCGWVVDRVGRKPLLLISIVIMILCLCNFLIFSQFKQSGILTLLAMGCLPIAIVAYAVGLGPIPLIFVAESFPQNSRSAAMSLNVLYNYVFNFASILIFPCLFLFYGEIAFSVFVLSLTSSGLYIIKIMPETKGRNAEEINNIFNKNQMIESDTYELNKKNIDV